MPTFGTPKRVFHHGHGSILVDVDGHEYVDLFSGIAVGGLGQVHPDVLEATVKQMATLGHISNLYASKPQIELASKLTGLVKERTTADVRVFFSNSGTEANEAAFKLSRLTGRTKIVAIQGSFHGRTMGALALTATQKYRAPFEPLPGEVVFAPFGDADALADLVDDRTAAVVMETIQGESGVQVPPDDYLARARDITHEHGALLWVDEVQTGMGRCGEWFTSLTGEVTPDVITLAKGLGNGMPIGATIAIGDAATLFTPGSHGTTFGGNPVSCAAGVAVIDVIERDDLLGQARTKGAEFSRQVTELKHPMIDHVRGRGLLIGIQLTQDVAVEVADNLLERGWIVNAARPDVIRLAPPLIIDASELTRFVPVLADALTRARP